MSRPVREASRSCPSSMKASARTPSHFISYAQPASPRGGTPGVASIGGSLLGSRARPAVSAGPGVSGKFIEIAAEDTRPGSLSTQPCHRLIAMRQDPAGVIPHQAQRQENQEGREALTWFPVSPGPDSRSSSRWPELLLRNIGIPAVGSGPTLQGDAGDADLVGTRDVRGQPGEPDEHEAGAHRAGKRHADATARA